ncbi:hypothetical protein [Sphingomonas profundi]|uniref:hypothetical protein n=1 Tax=Alterirhizorhabdus profundi TaxID=2681549 RepID=UPI0012E76864|nr:hypothetical protein [Sphingomonas profundi]
MSTGARSTEQWREHRALLEAIQRGGPVSPPEPPAPPPAPVLEDATTSPLERFGGIALAIVGLLWVAAIVTSLQVEAAPVAEIAGRISLASGPLALLGILYLLLQRTSRREARRFGQTAAAMRAEATALDETIARLAARIDDNRKAVAEHSQELLSLGEDSALRLAEIGAQMRNEAKVLGRQAEQLESATTGAFSDMGVLMADLPRVEAQVHGLSELLRDTGRDANDRAAALSVELKTLADRAREVDEVAGGAAQRLSAHLARIESISDAAGNRIDAAADGIARTVDSALTSAADAVDATRASIDTQRAALMAMVEQGKAAFARAAGDAAEALEDRIGRVAAEVEAIGIRLGGHDTAARALLDMLAERIAGIDRALAEADLNGTARVTQLAQRLRALGEDAQGIGGAIERGGAAAETLIARGERLRDVVAGCAAEFGERLPALMEAIEAEATRGGTAIEAVMPRAEALVAGVEDAGRALATLDDRLAAQRAALDGIGETAREQLEMLEARAAAVDAVLAEAGERALALAGGAGPQLVEALLRVRETATQAADHAGRALGEAVQSAADRLGAESRRALDEQLAGAVEDKLAAIASASDRAVAAAQEASRRLTDEMTAIAATASAVEKRLGEARASEPVAGEDGVSARVAHLIEQLNSTAIDVARLLASDIPDTLWAAYLKGDRGVFTRRAARLVEASESKEIARRYEADAGFRDQVNRYIHDFEAMLRHILATRDGSLLGVTLLSADMGKLYVALAQAIERLRT